MISPSEPFLVQALELFQRIPGAESRDPLLGRITLWIFLLSLAAVVVFTVFILVLHRRNSGKLLAEKRWKDAWLLQLLDPTHHGELQPLGRHQILAFAELWSRVHGSVRGEFREGLLEASRKAGTVDHCLRLLRRGSVREKLRATELLGDHLAREAESYLLPLARGRDPFLSLAATHALLQIDPRHHFPSHLHDLLSREDWPVARIHDILSEIDPELLAAHLPGHLLRWAPAPPPRALRTLDLLPEESRSDLIQAVFQRAEGLAPETEAALLREIRSPEHLGLVRRGLDSPHWPVVVAALNTIAKLGTRDDMPRLTELLSHAEWWVRYRAALAMVHLPGFKPIELELLAMRHPDRYGREMLRFALAEGNLR